MSEAEQYPHLLYISTLELYLKISFRELNATFAFRMTTRFVTVAPKFANKAKRL